MAIKDSTGGFPLRSAAKDDGPEGARQVDLTAADPAGAVPPATIDEALAARIADDAADSADHGGLDAPAFGSGTGGKAALADRVGSPLDDAAAEQDAGPRFGKDAISGGTVDPVSGATPLSPVGFSNSLGEVKSVHTVADGDGMFLGVDVGAMRFEKEATEAADEFDANRGTGSGSGGESGDGGTAGSGSDSGSGSDDSGDGAADVIHEQDNADGSHSSVYGDGTIITTHPDGTQETSYADGTVETDHPDGTLVTEYPDGSTQTIHPDGTIEETPPTEPEGSDGEGSDGEGDEPPPEGEGDGEGDEGEGSDGEGDTPAGDGSGDGSGESTGDGSSVESTPGDDTYDLPPDLLVGLDDLAGLRAHRGGQNDPGTETQPVEDDLGFGSGSVSGPVPDLKSKLLGDPDELGEFGTGARPVGDVAPGNVHGNVDPGLDADPEVQTSGPEERDTTHEIEPPAGESGTGSGSDEGADDGFVDVRHTDLQRVDDDRPDELEDLIVDLG